MNECSLEEKGGKMKDSNKTIYRLCKFCKKMYLANINSELGKSICPSCEMKKEKK